MRCAIIKAYPGDRRAKTLSLTGKGCGCFMEHIDVSYRSFYKLLDAMKPKDREDFMKAMEILVRTLGN